MADTVVKKPRQKRAIKEKVIKEKVIKEKIVIEKKPRISKVKSLSVSLVTDSYCFDSDMDDEYSNESLEEMLYSVRSKRIY